MNASTMVAITLSRSALGVVLPVEFLNLIPDFLVDDQGTVRFCLAMLFAFQPIVTESCIPRRAKKLQIVTIDATEIRSKEESEILLR